MPRRKYRDDVSRFPEYVPVSERKACNRLAAERLRKKGRDAHPVVIEQRSIVRTWWGKSWCANLERYADYSNRIGRGRSYVRHGAIIDLRIEPGTVSALVQGSRGDPYRVEIGIRSFDSAAWHRLREAALPRLDSLSDLLAGRFPKALQETFFARGSGLFPAPAEIEFTCSCPDWASMCKHVAAVLYGVGNRLDEEPQMLFTLRGVSAEDLLNKTVDAAAQVLLDNAETADGEDVLADADVPDVFGIEFDDDTPSAAPPLPSPETKHATSSKPKASAKTPSKPDSAATSAKSTKKRSSTGKKKIGRKKRTPPRRGSMIDQLLEAVPKTTPEFGTDDLFSALPGWTERQVRNTLARAIAAGHLERTAHGVYRKAFLG